MAIIFLSCLTFSALVILSLSMTKHHQQIRNKKLEKHLTSPIRRTGWILMTLVIIMAIYILGFGVGLAIFFNALAVVAFIHVWLLSYAPKYLVPLAIIMPIISGISWATN